MQRERAWSTGGYCRHVTRLPRLSAMLTVMLTVVRVPERNSRKSCAMPPLKKTPFSGL
jgi:hypothetical protein